MWCQKKEANKTQTWSPFWVPFLIVRCFTKLKNEDVLELPKKQCVCKGETSALFLLRYFFIKADLDLKDRHIGNVVQILSDPSYGMRFVGACIALRADV